MNVRDQVTLLARVEEDSLPDYALLRLNGEQMTPEEEERCERFCTGVAAELVSQGKATWKDLKSEEPTTTEPGFVPNLENMSALFQRFPRGSLPAYAVKLVEQVVMLDVDLTEDELKQCEAFATRLAAREPPKA